MNLESDVLLGPLRPFGTLDRREFARADLGGLRALVAESRLADESPECGGSAVPPRLFLRHLLHFVLEIRESRLGAFRAIRRGAADVLERLRRLQQLGPSRERGLVLSELRVLRVKFRPASEGDLGVLHRVSRAPRALREFAIETFGDLKARLETPRRRGHLVGEVLAEGQPTLSRGPLPTAVEDGLLEVLEEGVGIVGRQGAGARFEIEVELTALTGTGEVARPCNRAKVYPSDPRDRETSGSFSFLSSTSILFVFNYSSTSMVLV